MAADMVEKVVNAVQGNERICVNLWRGATKIMQK